MSREQKTLTVRQSAGTKREEKKPGEQSYHQIFQFEIPKEWEKEKRILSYDWSSYVFHAPSKVYKHPNLDWKTIYTYYKKFYRGTMLNPGFIFRRIVRDIKNNELFWDIYYFIKTLRYEW